MRGFPMGRASVTGDTDAFGNSNVGAGGMPSARCPSGDCAQFHAEGHAQQGVAEEADDHDEYQVQP